MADQKHEPGVGPGPVATDNRTRSAAENLRQLTEASKQLFEAGKQSAESLSELSARVEHASDVGSKVLTSPWLVAAGAVLAGTVIIMMPRRQ